MKSLSGCAGYEDYSTVDHSHCSSTVQLGGLCMLIGGAGLNREMIIKRILKEEYVVGRVVP